MKILYIYPHPDDESFGPAGVMSKQLRQGHEVHLLTLTRGGATKQREKYKYSVKKMGQVRLKEMEAVAKALNLSSLKVLDLPDSGLKEMDPREIEDVIREHIVEIEPFVVITYPAHGISGFQDHLVTHAAVKRVFVELREHKWFLRRLAFTTLPEREAKKIKKFSLNWSEKEEIDCVVELTDLDIENHLAALDCYKTYKDVIKSSGIKKLVTDKAYFEFYRESFDPPIDDLTTDLPAL